MAMTYTLNSALAVQDGRWATTTAVRQGAPTKVKPTPREEELRFSQTAAPILVRADDDALFAGPSILDEVTAERAMALRAQPRTELPARPLSIREP